MSYDTAIERTEFEVLELPLAEEFTISRGSTETTENVVVRIADRAGRVGIGGAAPSEYYGGSIGSVEAVLPELLSAVESVEDPALLRQIERELAADAPESPAARAAVSIAVHDLVATQADEPLYRRFGLDPARTPTTSYTVGIASPAEMAERARRISEAGYPILKVKLGTEDDRERIDAIRRVAPQAYIRVDANGEWTPEEAIEKLDWLANANVQFVEQPVAGDDIEGLRRVAESSVLPVAADESCVTAEDVPAVADAVDIVVVKLMKCGGLGPARRQIAAAHAHGLDVMLGCMVESNASIAAACHLSPVAEYADLDGSLLLDSDPYDGVAMPGGKIELASVERGTGVERPGE
jgi:L-alanine-DL-glutamate epimerase-like enolase superfamily enzyme